MNEDFVWIVGMWDDEQRWEVGGLYPTRERALEMCTDPGWWIAKLPFDQPVIREHVEVLVQYPKGRAS